MHKRFVIILFLSFAAKSFELNSQSVVNYIHEGEGPSPVLLMGTLPVPLPKVEDSEPVVSGQSPKWQQPGLGHTFQKNIIFGYEN